MKKIFLLSLCSILIRTSFSAEKYADKKLIHFKDDSSKVSYEIERLDRIYYVTKQIKNAKKTKVKIGPKKTRVLEMVTAEIIMAEDLKKLSKCKKIKGQVTLLPINKSSKICQNNKEQDEKYFLLKKMLESIFNK